MKNKFLALAALALTFGACSDDDSSSLDYGKLTQRWYFVSDKVEGETYPYEDHETCGKDYIELMEGGMLHFGDVYTCDGTAPVTAVEDGSWAREGNELVIALFSEPTVLTIKKVNSSTLEVSEVYDWDGDGDEETVTTVLSSND